MVNNDRLYTKLPKQIIRDGTGNLTFNFTSLKQTKWGMTQWSDLIQDLSLPRVNYDSLIT